MKLLIIFSLLLFLANHLLSKEVLRTSISSEDGGLAVRQVHNSYSKCDTRGAEIIEVDSTKQHRAAKNSQKPKSAKQITQETETHKSGVNSMLEIESGIEQIATKNKFAKNLLGLIIKNESADLSQSGMQSISYFEQFSGKKIASIRFIRLHPFGTSFQDTTLSAQKWYEKAGNRLHMNTARSKLRMQLLFHQGEMVDPLLMAENEKIMRDLEYLEDVFIRLDPVANSQDEVNVVILTKDKFEYAFSMSINSNNSDMEVVNENMFGIGHRLSIGMAQKNSALPHMGIYFSYGVNNLLGKFINSTIGYSDTYLKKGWNLSAERKFLSYQEMNAGGFSLERVSKYNHITENHPIELDSAIAYNVNDFWFLHAFPNATDPMSKTILSFRYYDQKFKRSADDIFGDSPFIRNHDFFLTSLSFTKRHLYKNNQIYGYGVTEDIPYGHYYEFTTGLDQSQYGLWPYFGMSVNNSYIDQKGRYYNASLAFDGFIKDGKVTQGTLLAGANFFSNKFYALGDPCRIFVKTEFMEGINRFKEEFLKIDGKFGIRDFYTHDLKGFNRLKLNLEVVRYLNLNFHNFKFTNYLFSDIAFLSNNLSSLLTQNFYTGIGTGFRIYNESLVFKIIDARITWFPFTPPEGISPFGTNLQGLTKSRFEDFMGRKPEQIRYQ